MPTLNRRIALAVVPVLAWMRLTPNQVTVLGLLAGLFAATRFGHGTSGWLAGALWLQLSFILDNCDGTLARRLNRTSGFGSWLDTASDCLVNMAFFAAVAVGLHHDTGHLFWLVGGAVAAVGVFFSYAMAFAVQVHRRGAAAWRHPDPPAGSEPESELVGFRKRAREDFSFIVIAAVLLHHLEVLLWCGLISSYAIGLTNLRTITGRTADAAALADDEALPT
jgi:phosphatidylglycerophosphate synthase